MIEQLVENALKKQPREDDIGEQTPLKCSCGGNLHKYQSQLFVKTVGKPRFSRKKRQTKKNHKSWTRKYGQTLLLAKMMRPIHSIGFICPACGKHENFYSAMGRNLFQIEHV